jgi:predicted small lipoprotein YifL
MRICWAQYTLWALIAVLGVVSMLSGCGAKGDLFLPPHDTQQTEEK